MSVPRWPLDLSQYPLRDGLSVEALDNVVRAKTNTGPGLSRASELAEWNQVKCTVVLRTDAERDAFKRWHRDTLQSGVQPFAWPAMDRIIGDLEAGYNLVMTAQPKFSPRGVAAWTVALEMVSLPAGPPNYTRSSVYYVDDDETSATISVGYGIEYAEGNSPYDYVSVDLLPTREQQEQNSG